MTIYRIILLSLAGALGALCRYWLAGFIHRFSGVGFPWGTLTVNVTGCFFAGLFWTFFENRWPLASQARVIVMVGFMGAFTTFSTFMLETSELVRAAQWFSAAGNVFLQNGIGFTALIAGIALGRMI